MLKKIGEIATCWAQAETHLNCLFAVLLNVTPDEAAQRLKKFRTAAQAAQGARNIAASCLDGEELKTVNAVLERLDLIRPRRNRIQHDVWARKGSVDDRLFVVHADQYLDVTTKMLALVETEMAESEKSKCIINLGEDFAATNFVSYTLDELQNLESELSDINKDLMSAMFARLMKRKK